MQWTRAFSMDKLPVGGAKLFKQGREQVAVFRPSDAEIFAVDNRCPHEGYPLIQGSRDGCTLTCCWHNYKFDLRTGSCLKGDEAVRTYPVRIAEGSVELDLTPPDPTAAIPAYWASLAEGLHAYRVGQSVRDVVRLLSAGVTPEAVAAFLAGWDGARSEYGASHALAVAHDVLAWLPRYPGPRFAIPLAQLIDLTARGTVRRPERPVAEAVDPGDDPVAAGVAFQAAVESEDGLLAEGILLGALARGWRRAELEHWFFALCADHFLSFGHRLIYQTKAFDLLDAADWQHASPILRGHLAGIVNGTREDVLPAWAGFRKRLADLDLPALYATPTDENWHGEAAVTEALLTGTVAESFTEVVDALSAGAPLPRLVDAISLAAAERMLRFDVTIDADPGNQDNWLSVTHIQTFASALRHTLSRFERPEVLRLVLFAARFVHHHRVLDGTPEVYVPAPTPDAAATLAAIGAGDIAGALSQTAAVFTDTEQTAALKDALMDVAISDRFSTPIVSAHAMKNLLVAFEESAATCDPRPMLAVVRLLTSPLQQRWTHRGALEAVAFVTEGKIPKLLAP
ncbi:MAG: nitrite reductase/ring-hydroxylating ferredoxin subunit [Myxococcota bacterium]|jgi:nitrite reductase/ring-hydroxylating ferredoxin subunit